MNVPEPSAPLGVCYDEEERLCLDGPAMRVRLDFLRQNREFYALELRRRRAGWLLFEVRLTLFEATRRLRTCIDLGPKGRHRCSCGPLPLCRAREGLRMALPCDHVLLCLLDPLSQGAGLPLLLLVHR